MAAGTGPVKPRRERTPAWARWRRPWPRAGVSPRAAALLAGAVMAVAAAAVIPAPATDTDRTTGDEPHYLLTARALGERASLDLAGVYDDGPRPFHRDPLAPQGRVLADGRLVAPHDPLLPALLALPMAAGGWVAAKAVMALVAGLLGAALVWVATARLGVAAGRAAAVVAVLGASAPLAVYGAQVYPELPAALAVTLGVGAVTGRPRRASHVVAVAAVVALPWLSVKYVPLAAVLALCELVAVRRHRGWRGAGVVAGVLGVAGVAYVAAHLAWYGGLTVYAAGRFFAEHGGQMSVVGTQPDYLGRSTRLLGLLADADFGLAAWQPAWLLAVPAVAALCRRGRAPGAGGAAIGGVAPRTAVLAVLAVGWLMATFVAATMHGWWFPGRHVLVVLPAALLVIAWWARDDRRRLAAVVALGAVGVAIHAWLALSAGWADPLVVDVHDTASPLRQGLQWLLPNYRLLDTGAWLRHGVWTALALAGLAVGWRRARPSAADPARVPGWGR